MVLTHCVLYLSKTKSLKHNNDKVTMDKPLDDHGQFHDRKTFDKLNEFIVLQYQHLSQKL